ncbi:MAG: hypothetical protein AAB523_00925 [Patescibacteria group bacterium]
MIEILPAIIPEDFEDLKEKLAQVRGIAPIVQIDIVDGKFAPHPSWPYYKGDQEHFQKILREEEGLPFWEDFYFEADLMIERPEEHIEDFIFAGFSRLVVHLESTEKMGEIIEMAKHMDTEIGIAINIDTPNSELEEWIERINFVQFMGIEKIGSQGQPFDPRVIEKISTLRREHPDIIISVDGGVSLEIAPFLVGAGAERLISGSAIFESDDIEKTINDFRNIHPEGMYEE